MRQHRLTFELAHAALGAGFSYRRITVAFKKCQAAGASKVDCYPVT